MLAIKTDNLRKEYKDVVAVDNLSLEIDEGELFALLGVNGAGKTTTIKMLSTLTSPTSGEAYILGHSVLKEPDKIKELIDISMQETAVARKLTVAENIEFYARLSGQNKDEIKATKEYIYNTFDLNQVAKKSCSQTLGRLAEKTIYCACSRHQSKNFIFG